MAKRNNTGNSNPESRVKLLEKRLTKLETQIEKKAVRASLLAGLESAHKFLSPFTSALARSPG